MTKDIAIHAGGWDARYAVVRALVIHDDIAAALVDPDGDGGSIDLDEYYRDPDGQWVGGNSGGAAGDSGTSWLRTWCAYRRTAQGATVLMDQLRRDLRADGKRAWRGWLFATPSRDEHRMPASRVVSGAP